MQAPFDYEWHGFKAQIEVLIEDGANKYRAFIEEDGEVFESVVAERPGQDVDFILECLMHDFKNQLAGIAFGCGADKAQRRQEIAISILERA